MKKLLFVLLAVFVLFPLPATAKKKQRIICNIDNTVFRVTGNAASPPFSWKEAGEKTDSDGNPIDYFLKGYGADIAEKIIQEIGFKHYKITAEGTFDEAIDRTKYGRIDAIFGIHFSDKPYSGLENIFPAYKTSQITAIVRRDRHFPFSTKEDLIGKKGVIRKDESFGSFFDNYVRTKLDVIQVKDAGEAFEKLMKAEVDYMLTSRTMGHAEAIRYGIRPKVIIAKKNAFSVKMFFAFSKLSPCRKYSKVFKEKITEWKKDGTLEKMLQKSMKQWTSKHYDINPEERFRPVRKAR